MDGILAEVGRRHIERWLSVLLLPGLIFVAVAWTVTRLGHARPFDLDAVASAWHDLADRATRSTADLIVTAVAALTGALLAGLAAHGVARIVEAAWTARPSSRTAWLSRRTAALDRRVQAQYHGLRITLLWPRLWLLIGDEERNTVAAARERVWEAALQTGWGALYLVLIPVWWPAALIATVTWALAIVTARRAVTSYIALVEAMVDIHQSTIADRFGFTLIDGALPPDAVAQINDRLHK
ncbi:hypothetical protein ACTMTJ_42545 [Phytohabitans sp. LJ34]|uniref:hypothetical protein n=1 Tax=Phytohabitans sp. LJ34 TaxID=3452217 RepID=UPI003F88C6C4